MIPIDCTCQEYAASYILRTPDGDIHLCESCASIFLIARRYPDIQLEELGQLQSFHTLLKDIRALSDDKLMMALTSKSQELCYYEYDGPADKAEAMNAITQLMYQYMVKGWTDMAITDEPKTGMLFLRGIPPAKEAGA